MAAVETVVVAVVVVFVATTKDLKKVNKETKRHDSAKKEIQKLLKNALEERKVVKEKLISVTGRKDSALGVLRVV